MKNPFHSPNYEKYYKGVIPYIKKEKNQQYLTVILTFGASIFFALFAINPSLSTIAKLNKQISDSKFVEQKLSQKINNLSSLSQQYLSIQNDIPNIINAVPKTPEAPTLIAQVQSIADDSSVKIIGVEISPLDLTQDQATISSALNFSLTGEGQYQNIKTFMNSLIKMQRVVSVDYVSIIKVASGGDVTININGTAFFKR